MLLSVFSPLPVSTIAPKLSQIMSIFAPDYFTTIKMTRAGLISFIAIFFVVAGCQRETRPAGVLSKEEYAKFLVSVYVAEAKLNTYVITPDSAMKLFLPYERSLQKKFDTSDSVIQKTYQYYLAHPLELEQVYTAVIDTLNLMEQKATSKLK
jgi:hypothetical protein